jgi:thiol-disulfide isomerase/thioredoxin
MKLRTPTLLTALILSACSSAPAPFPTGEPGQDSGPGTTPDSGTGLCTYPEGTTGTGPGQLVEAGFNWQGYAPGQQASTTISMSDFFDCDGSKGINALIFDVSATWCAACQSEATDLPKLAAQYEALGIKHITLMVQDTGNVPATLATATDWRTKYGLTGLYVAADPGFSFQPSGSSGSVSLPMTVVVDPRTMKIVKVGQGYVAAYPLQPDADAVAVAKKNAAH